MGFFVLETFVIPKQGGGLRRLFFLAPPIQSRGGMAKVPERSRESCHLRYLSKL